jgi:hypothetical protein
VEHVYELKRLPLWPVLKVTFVLLLVIGVLIAIFYSLLLSGLGFMAGTLSGTPFGSEFMIFQRLGLIMIPVVAFSYAVFGTISVLVCVLVYNLIASVTGGLELILTQRASALRREPRPSQQEESEAHIPERPIDGF